MGTFQPTYAFHKTARWFGRLIYKAIQRLMTLDVTHLMRLDLEHTVLPSAAPSNFVFRFLTADDIRHFAEMQNELSAEFADRVESGRDFCFAALSKGQLAGYAWYAIGSIEAEHNRGGSLDSGVAMSFPDHMAFMYKGFVHPEFRGKGLYGHINARALEQLEPRGVTSVISTADWSNQSALNCCWRLGYQNLGLIWRGGWGRLMATLPPRQGRSLGISFGHGALVHPRTQSKLLC